MNPCSRSATHSRQHDTTQLKKKKKLGDFFSSHRVFFCFGFVCMDLREEILSRASNARRTHTRRMTACPSVENAQAS